MRGTAWQSVAISRNQSQSVAINGNAWHCVASSGDEGHGGWQSLAIGDEGRGGWQFSRTQWPSEGSSAGTLTLMLALNSSWRCVEAGSTASVSCSRLSVVLSSACNTRRWCATRPGGRFETRAQRADELGA